MGSLGSHVTPQPCMHGTDKHDTHFTHGTLEIQDSHGVSVLVCKICTECSTAALHGGRFLQDLVRGLAGSLKDTAIRTGAVAVQDAAGGRG